jgi:hypothetical protein
LRGHLAGAGVLAQLTCSGDSLALTGPGLPGAALVCRLDRRGPGATALLTVSQYLAAGTADEPNARHGR